MTYSLPGVGQYLKILYENGSPRYITLIYQHWDRCWVLLLCCCFLRGRRMEVSKNDEYPHSSSILSWELSKLHEASSQVDSPFVIRLVRSYKDGTPAWVHGLSLLVRRDLARVLLGS